MEDLERRALLGVAGIGAIGALAAVAKAGPLNPPAGPVSSTGKTMQEIADKIARTDAGLAEARTPVSATTTPGNASFLFRITQAGSYYLTGNITVTAANQGAIEIVVPGVTLDLNGFTITGNNTGLSVNGIQCNAGRAKVLNGTVLSFSGSGVSVASNYNTVSEIVSLSNATGITVGANSRVERCTAAVNTGGGIVVGANSVVLASIASSNGATGITLATGATATACTSSTNSSAGFSLGSCYGCTARQNGTDGFSGCSVLDACISNSNSSDGAGTCDSVHRCAFGSNIGLGVNSSNLVTDSHFFGNTGGGVSTSTGGAVHRCRFDRSNNTTPTISVASRSVVSHNTILGGGVGINASLNCLIENNLVGLNTGTADGFVTSSSCMLRQNVSVGNGGAGFTYGTGTVVTGNMASGNSLGGYVTAAGSPLVGTVVSTSAGMATAPAHANFSV